MRRPWPQIRTVIIMRCPDLKLRYRTFLTNEHRQHRTGVQHINKNRCKSKQPTEFYGVSPNFANFSNCNSWLCKLFKLQHVAFREFQRRTVATLWPFKEFQRLPKSVKEFQRIPKNSKPICFNFPPVPKKNDCSRLKSRGVGKVHQQRQQTQQQ